MAEFFVPRLIKLIFLAEWTLFIVFELVCGGLSGKQEMIVAAYPLLIFYLLASIFAHLSRRTRRVAPGSIILAIAISLGVLDQLIKAWVTGNIPVGASFPLIPGWLNIAHHQNVHASWLLSRLNNSYVPISLLGIGVMGMVIFSIFYHRYYVSRYRQSLWADIALVGICAGLLSWLGDILWRGKIIDYINLPGVVTADFKDILIYLGSAAVLAEVLDASPISQTSLHN